MDDERNISIYIKPVEFVRFLRKAERLKQS